MNLSPLEIVIIIAFALAGTLWIIISTIRKTKKKEKIEKKTEEEKEKIEK